MKKKLLIINLIEIKIKLTPKKHTNTLAAKSLNIFTNKKEVRGVGGKEDGFGLSATGVDPISLVSLLSEKAFPPQSRNFFSAIIIDVVYEGGDGVDVNGSLTPLM